FTQIAMEKKQNSKTMKLINQISQTSDNIPPSPTPQLFYHTNCAAPLPTFSSSLSTTSSLNILSTISHLEDSRKNLTSIFQNLKNTSQLFQENPQTTTFDLSIHTTSSAISTSIP
ncbi:18767_t:CDS:2, partial [Gigaspora margarita]